MKMIHWSRLHDLMDRRDGKGRPLPFQLKYIKKSTGEVREYTSCVMTSFHASGETVNILPENEQHPRKILRLLIIEFNNHKVYI